MWSWTMYHVLYRIVSSAAIPPLIIYSDCCSGMTSWLQSSLGSIIIECIQCNKSAYKFPHAYSYLHSQWACSLSQHALGRRLTPSSSGQRLTGVWDSGSFSFQKLPGSSVCHTAVGPSSPHRHFGIRHLLVSSQLSEPEIDLIRSRPPLTGVSLAEFIEWEIPVSFTRPFIFKKHWNDICCNPSNHGFWWHSVQIIFKGPLYAWNEPLCVMDGPPQFGPISLSCSININWHVGGGKLTPDRKSLNQTLETGGEGRLRGTKKLKNRSIEEDWARHTIHKVQHSFHRKLLVPVFSCPSGMDRVLRIRAEWGVDCAISAWGRGVCLLGKKHLFQGSTWGTRPCPNKVCRAGHLKLGMACAWPFATGEPGQQDTFQQKW